MPVRIQRKRAKGWRMPEGAVYVGRPTKWGNPWRVHRGCDDARNAVREYRALIIANQQAPELYRLPLHELRGKDLACWCPLDQPCHADVLLELANAPEVK
jgi:Domain of unknown function (DUF4326)